MNIYLYDTETDCIGSGILSSAYIQTQLQAAAGQDVEVHISSVGGSAFDAIAIYDLLKKYPGKVTTYIDALAASAASIVAMGGQVVAMSKYALLMIHKPMVGSGGNADELLKDVQMLNVVQSRLAQIYMDKTGLDEVTVNSLINSVTWMTADQALDLGFIDQIEDYSQPITNSALIKKYTSAAPAIYQRCINKILNTNNNMNMENKELIDRSTSVLDKIMNFFKKVVNKQTITDKGTLHHAGELDESTEVYQDEDMSTPAAADTYTTASGQKVAVKDGKVQSVTPADPDAEDDDSSFELSTYNLSVGSTSFIAETLSKTGAGAVSMQEIQLSGSISSIQFTGNPTVSLSGNFTGDCRGGINFGTNPVNITTSVTFSTWTAGNVAIAWANSFLIASGKTFTSAGLSSTLGGMTTTGTINGGDATAIFDNRSTYTHNNASAPMSTGKLYCNQAANTFIYGLAGNQDIAVRSDATPGYQNLTLQGSGAKRLLGNVSVKGIYTVTGPATLNTNGFALTNP